MTRRREKIVKGDLAICRQDVDPSVDVLLLWSSPKASFTDDTIEVDPREILLVLDCDREAFSKEDAYFAKEWKSGACLVLANEGKKGWVGEGWITRVAGKYA